MKLFSSGGFKKKLFPFFTSCCTKVLQGTTYPYSVKLLFKCQQIYVENRFTGGQVFNRWIKWTPAIQVIKLSIMAVLLTTL